MEIDITDLFQALAETNLMLFSASPAEMGEDAGTSASIDRLGLIETIN